MPVFGGGGGEVLPHGAGAAGERLHQRGPVLREDGAAAKKKKSRASGVFEAKSSGTVFWGWWNGKPKDTDGLFYRETVWVCVFRVMKQPFLGLLYPETKRTAATMDGLAFPDASTNACSGSCG